MGPFGYLIFYSNIEVYSKSLFCVLDVVTQVEFENESGHVLHSAHNFVFLDMYYLIRI